MRRQLGTAVLATIALIVLLGLAYPLVMTGLGQAFFSRQANGSLVKVGGRTVGSSLIGQAFSDKAGAPLPQYFQPRPSAAGNGYDAMASGASNLGPSNQTLLQDVKERAVAYRRFNRLPAGTEVPVDAVTSSGSGLDPDISVANALDQAPRVAAARGLPPARVVALVRQHTDGRKWGVLGEKTVNVLDLNIALDRAG
ncbi:MAG TPA: K(+)-transporting ATPase subunit C [Acidimicrobiales bacterium]|nr:K(+)-transporting ATPase subunit C [Acidimicrobiales bacterium]